MASGVTGSEPVSDAAARVVVGVDGSAESAQALRWASRLTQATGGHLEVVIAWQYPAGFLYGMGLPDGWRPDVNASSALHQLLDDVFGSSRPAGLVATVIEGHPAQVLVDASDGARLLVVGSRGHGGVAGLLLGSVSRICAERSKCPVLVVHGEPVPGEEPGHDRTADLVAGR